MRSKKQELKSSFPRSDTGMASQVRTSTAAQSHVPLGKGFAYTTRQLGQGLQLGQRSPASSPNRP